MTRPYYMWSLNKWLKEIEKWRGCFAIVQFIMPVYLFLSADLGHFMYAEVEVLVKIQMDMDQMTLLTIYRAFHSSLRSLFLIRPFSNQKKRQKYLSTFTLSQSLQNNDNNLWWKARENKPLFSNKGNWWVMIPDPPLSWLVNLARSTIYTFLDTNGCNVGLSHKVCVSVAGLLSHQPNWIQLNFLWRRNWQAEGDSRLSVQYLFTFIVKQDEQSWFLLRKVLGTLVMRRIKASWQGPNRNPGGRNPNSAEESWLVYWCLSLKPRQSFVQLHPRNEWSKFGWTISQEKLDSF